jgi:hypothetical protein
MVSFLTLEQSLSFDTITKKHPSRAAAEQHMATVLAEGGWYEEEAIAAARNSRPVLVVDNGDDHTIEIRELEAA